MSKKKKISSVLVKSDSGQRAAKSKIAINMTEYLLEYGPRVW
jgi:hypothetical protein